MRRVDRGIGALAYYGGRVEIVLKIREGLCVRWIRGLKEVNGWGIPLENSW